MKNTPNQTWSFLYSHDGGRFSVEIEAKSQFEAERQIKAMSRAECIGAVMQDSSDAVAPA